MALLKYTCLQNLRCQLTNQTKITVHVVAACAVIKSRDHVVLSAEGEFSRFLCVARGVEEVL